VKRTLVAVAVLLISSSIAQAGTIHGTVKNGTTGKPAANVEVILIQLQGGMQPVSTTKSGPQGEFTFDNPGLGAQPMLIRAVYNGINFHQPAPPGKNDVVVEVFEPTKDAKTIAIATRIVFFQPNGSTLIVGEEYAIENKSQPPQAYFRTDGNFDFALPANAKLQQVAAAGPAGMPVVQAPIDRTKDRYAIAYAFRPGQSTVRYSYELPYAGNAATVRVPMLYSSARLIVVAPPTMQITGDGLQAGGQEQGMNIYGRENVPAGTAVAVNVSGTAPPPSENSADSGQQGQDSQPGSAPSANVNIQQVPGRLDGLKWPIMGFLVVVFAMGAYLLSRKSVVTVPVGAASEDDLDAAPVAKNRAMKAAAPATATARPMPENADGNSPTLADVDAAVGNSLDSLKERIFRLELRRQAGTITEEEYAQERARTEKVLRDLVRG
jgi:hypothetical protein